MQTPDPFHSLRSQMDHLFDRFVEGFGFPSLPRFVPSAPWIGAVSGAVLPAVDVSELNGGYKISAELPGLDAKDISVSVSGGALVLRGEKREERTEKTENQHYSERSYGSFQRTFALPEGTDPDKITAEFAKGVLTISVPKTPAAQAQQKKIEVKAAA